MPGETAEGGAAAPDIERAVKDALEEAGLEVDAQVGKSSSPVGLAIRHPDFPSRYILGVECDGAKYVGPPTVRERDRLSSEVMKALGWSTLRIWSPDWTRDRGEEVARVLSRVEEIRSPPEPEPADETTSAEGLETALAEEGEAPEEIAEEGRELGAVFDADAGEIDVEASVAALAEELVVGTETVPGVDDAAEAPTGDEDDVELDAEPTGDPEDVGTSAEAAVGRRPSTRRVAGICGIRSSARCVDQDE